MANPYDELRAAYSNDSRVQVSQGKGAQGIRVPVGGKLKMLIMFSKGELLLQLPPSEVNSLVQQGLGRSYDPGTGKTMANRVIIGIDQQSDWSNYVELCINKAPLL